MKKFVFVLLLFVCFNQKLMADHASPSFETGAAGAVMTTPGSTLPGGKFVVGGNIHYIELDDISDAALEAAGAADEDIHSVDNLFQFQANLAYGWTDDLTLGASIPYLERNNVRAAHNDMGVGEVEVAGDASGLGDLRLFGQYRFYHDAAQDLAVTAGVKTPTGTTDERETGGGLFETDHQPGSGSWDPFFGLAYNRSFGRTGFSANVLYTATTEGSQQTDLGDSFNYNLALSTRLFSAAEEEHHHHHHGDEHHEHHEHLLDYLDVVLELNGDVRGRDAVMGIKDENTRGHLLYLSPGMRIGLAERWSLYASVGLPIVNDSNGIQSDPDYRVVGGISTSF